jgi:hypothetical protein
MCVVRDEYASTKWAVDSNVIVKYSTYQRSNWYSNKVRVKMSLNATFKYNIFKSELQYHPNSFEKPL